MSARAEVVRPAVAGVPADVVRVAWLRPGSAAAAQRAEQSSDSEMQAVAFSVSGKAGAAKRSVAAASAVPTGAAAAWVQEPQPVASLWKLFVHIYLVGQQQRVPAYLCTGKAADRQAEQYCCDASAAAAGGRGGRVTRAQALARSCGAYFQPQRLGIRLPQWQRFWQSQLPGAQHQWLHRAIPQAETRVAPAQLLAALAGISPALRQRAAESLLENTLSGLSGAALESWGGSWRVKTYTWQAADGVYTGGAAGWLVDGTAVWFAGRGSSSAVVRDAAAQLHQTVFQSLFGGGGRSRAVRQSWVGWLEQASADCVRVRHFAEYPLRRVMPADNAVRPVRPVREAATRTAAAGQHGQRRSLEPMQYVAHFHNGNRFGFTGSTRQWLSVADRASKPPAAVRLWGEYPLEEYVARVVDREGSATEQQAARALAILARSYVQQFARRTDNCYQIDDSSALQRVSASPPSQAAAQAALWSASLVIDGAVPQYRLRPTASGRTPEGLPFMAWKTAAEQARKGSTALDILHHTWPALALAGLHGGTTCQPQPNLQGWLEQQQPAWHRILRSQAGYEPVPQVQVCTLTIGTPYSDMQRDRIYVQQHSHAVLPQHIRMGLLHEYLHLAFKYHPRGRDEDFIEETARRLHGHHWRGSLP